MPQRAAGVEPSERITGPLFDKYLDLDSYPEAKDALRNLKSLGVYKLAVLSNGQHRHAVSAGEEFRPRRLP